MGFPEALVGTNAPGTTNTPWAVVYFDQCLGTAHSKDWSKYAFAAFVVLKSWRKEKSKNYDAKLSKKLFFFNLHPNAGSVFYSQKNHILSGKNTFYL